MSDKDYVDEDCTNDGISHASNPWQDRENRERAIELATREIVFSDVENLIRAAQRIEQYLRDGS